MAAMRGRMAMAITATSVNSGASIRKPCAELKTCAGCLAKRE